ncbi:Coatomer delta subunit like protein [Aduncisulcus paluster]|uniref:Coatomer subunit delta n=1 Tax=Aduncisulcus paluster TaxID=2918883 RepID=A0ABQ5K0C0_9EUKA|nr:Coatomer delta subunit like protein [Aduncisulcus paluster]
MSDHHSFCAVFITNNREFDNPIKHSIVEYRNFLFVYRVVQNTIVVLLTKKSVNRVQALLTLQTICEKLPSIVNTNYPSKVLAKSFDIIFLLDEVISFGLAPFPLSTSAIDIRLEMESVAEKEAEEERKKQEREAARQRREAEAAIIAKQAEERATSSKGTLKTIVGWFTSDKSEKEELIDLGEPIDASSPPEPLSEPKSHPRSTAGTTMKLVKKNKKRF